MAAILESNRREPGGLFPPSPCRAKARTPQHGQPLGIGLQQPRAAWTSHAGLPSTAATRIPGAPLSQRTRRRTRTRMQVRSLHSLLPCGTHSASCFAENQNFLVLLFRPTDLLCRATDLLCRDLLCRDLLCRNLLCRDLLCGLAGLALPVTG